MDEKEKSYRPDWQPENAGEEFAVRVIKGSKNIASNSNENGIIKASQLDLEDLIEGVKKNNRTILGRAITLIESNSIAHQEKAQAFLNQLLPFSGNSIRIGITGVPGAGKSTLIETLGLKLIEQGHKVAVLAVDPSSTVTKGSILGDKTRMEKLAKEENCFIRPSPSGGTLGGVTRKSRETIIACEAAGYDVILVETVGVGQSEVTVRSMVDFFMLVLIAGAGDELQGIKKGIIELADVIVINKADGDNVQKANIAKSDYENALHYLQPASKNWITKAVTCSALTGAGIEDLWNMIVEFKDKMKSSGEFERRRKSQSLEWVFTMIEDELKRSFYNNPEVRKLIPQVKSQIESKEILPTQAAKLLLKALEQ